jgi:histone H2A
MEYLCAEVLNLSGEVLQQSKKGKRLTPRHVELAVRNDEDFSKLF